MLVGVVVALVAQQLVEQLDRRAAVARVEVEELERELLRLRAPPACWAVAFLCARARYLPGSSSGFDRSLKRPKLLPLTWRTYGVRLQHRVAAGAEPDLDLLVATNGRHRADDLDPLADLRLAALEAR